MYGPGAARALRRAGVRRVRRREPHPRPGGRGAGRAQGLFRAVPGLRPHHAGAGADRKSTRLNSSHANISYAVFCLKKKIFSTYILSFRPFRNTPKSTAPPLLNFSPPIPPLHHPILTPILPTLTPSTLFLSTTRPTP